MGESRSALFLRGVTGAVTGCMEADSAGVTAVFV
jgi:hypothetical protein